LAGKVSEARAKLIVWGVAFGGAGIAGGAVLLALSADRAFEWLPGLLLGLFISLLICLAFRIMRGAYSAPPVSAFASRAALAGGFTLAAFGAATLILLAAWLAALALGAEIGSALLQALIHTIILFVVTRMAGLSILNLAIAIQGSAEDSAPS
jgi:hypothetical protein